jgi:hypothetical protein
VSQSTIPSQPSLSLCTAPHTHSNGVAGQARGAWGPQDCSKLTVATGYKQPISTSTHHRQLAAEGARHHCTTPSLALFKRLEKSKVDRSNNSKKSKITAFDLWECVHFLEY